MNDMTKLSPEELATLKAQLFADVKAQVLEDLKTEEEKRRDALLREREQAKAAREAYVSQMKESTDAWVDILGIVQTSDGIKIDLDWNDAFVKYLRHQGITGSNDETIVQKWVTLLLRDMADNMEEALQPLKSTTSEFM